MVNQRPVLFTGTTGDTRQADDLSGPSGSREGFRLRMVSVGTELFRIDEVSHSSSPAAHLEPYPTILVAHPQAGRLWIRDRPGEATSQGSRRPVVVDPREGSRSGRSRSTDERVVGLELDPVGKVAHELSGLPADHLRFEPSTPISDDRARYYWGVVDHVSAVLDTDEIAEAPLVRFELFRSLAVAVLVAFPNNALDADGNRPAREVVSAEPAVVRRAVEFMDAHAQDDIDISRIAEAARIGPRGLQAAFRRHRDQTPLEYLRRARMAGAHADLHTADPTRGDTVAGIASRWGFTHPGRFSVEYRQVHGCSPSDTLRA